LNWILFSNFSHHGLLLPWMPSSMVSLGRARSSSLKNVTKRYRKGFNSN